MFLRILHKSRLPAKRMLSCVLSLLMLLSAATVAVPLLKIPAKAAPYNQTVDGIKEALDNGDEVRALQLFYEYNKDDERFSGVESQRQKGSITPNSTADNVQVRDQISPPYTDWNAGASLNLLQREMGLTGDYQFLNDSNMTITNPTLGISPADATIVTMNLDAPAAIGSLGGSWGGTPGRWNPANPWVAGTFDGPAPYGRRPTTYNSNSGWSNNPGDPYCLYLYGITGEHEYAWGPQPGNLAVHDVARFALRPARGQNSGTEPNSANSRDNPAADPLVAKTRNLFTALKEYDSIDDIPYVDSSAPATSLIPLKTEVRFTYYMSHSDKAVADQSTGDDGYWFAFFWNYLTGMDAPINSELRATKRVVDALNNAKNDPLFGDNATPAYIAAAFGLNESNLPATDSMSGSYSAAYDTFRYNTANSMLRSSTIDGVETLAEAYDIFDHFFAKEVIHGEDTPDPSDDVTRHRNIILKGVDAHRIAMQLNSNADPNGGSARGENYYGNPNEFLGNSKFPFGIMNAEGVKEFYNEGEYFTQEQAEALSLAIRGSLNAQSGSGKYENIMTYGSQPYVDDASTLAAMLGLRNFGYEAALGMMVWQGIDPHDEHFILDSVDPSSPWWFWTGLSDWYVNNSFSNYGRLHSYPYAAEPGGVSYLDHIVEQANSANVMPRYKEMSIEAFVVWVKNIQMVIDVWLTAALVFDPIMEFVEQQWMNPPNYHKGVSVDMTQDSDGNWIYDDLSGTYWNTGVFVHGMDPWQFIDLYNVGGLDPEEFEDELKMALQAIYQNRDDDNMPFSTIQIMNLVSIARNYNTMLDFFDDESVLKGLLGEFDVYEYDSFGDPVLDGSGDPVVLDTLDYYEEFKKIWNALTDEYSYRGELFFKLTDGLVGGVIEELVVTGKTGRMGYEPAWYAERNWFEGNMPPMPGRVLQLQSGLTVNELASLFRQYTHRYEAYELEAQRVKDEMSKFEMPDHWWSEIYEVQTPRQVSDDSTRSPSSLVMSNDWGEIVARTYRDDFGYALAKRLQNSVNAAMNEFRSVYYNTVGDANLEYDETTGELKNTFMNYMFARRILGRLDRTVIQHFTDEEALLYVNNLNVHNLVNITAVNPNHMPNFYDRNIYSAATSDEGRFDGKILTDSRTVLGDYYYIIAVMSAAIAAFEADPQWDHIQHYTNGDAFTGEYITRFGKGYEANVYDYRNDIARTTGEDYTVTGNTIQSLVDSLDGFASNADVGALLSALDLDLSSLGVSSAADLTLDNIIKTALGNMLYSNDTINMIVELVYGMVLPIFEDVFAEFSSTEMPDMLAPWSTLHIYSLHELLSNRDKVFGTTRQNQYTIANPPGNVQDGSFQDVSNANTISDLKIYPDLLGQAIVDAGLQSEFPAATQALLNPTTYNYRYDYTLQPTGSTPSGYSYNPDGTIDNTGKPNIDQGLRVAVNTQKDGYEYDVTVWQDPSIWQPAVLSDGSVDPDKGKLVIDWGLDNPDLSPDEKAEKFKRAASAALMGVYPLLQALLLGQSYKGMNAKVGFLSSWTRQYKNGSASNGVALAQASQDGNDIEMRVPTIHLMLRMQGNDGFAKLITPILEALAGDLGTNQIYDLIPTLLELRGGNTNDNTTSINSSASFTIQTPNGAETFNTRYPKNDNLPGWAMQADQSNDGTVAGTGPRASNVWHFASLMHNRHGANVDSGWSRFWRSNISVTEDEVGKPNNYAVWPTYTYNAGQTFKASEGFIRLLFRPIDGIIDQITTRPVNELLRILPNISYALSLDRIAPLLEGSLKLDIKPEVNGLIELGELIDAGLNSIIDDLPNGALTGGHAGFKVTPVPNAANASQAKDCCRFTNPALCPFQGNTDMYRSLAFSKYYYILGISAGGATVYEYNIVGEMEAMSVDIGADLLGSLDLSAYLGEENQGSNIATILGNASPGTYDMLPSAVQEFLGDKLGMYGPIQSAGDPLSGLSSKRWNDGTWQERHNIDTEVPNLLYGLLTTVLRKDVLGEFVGMDFFGDTYAQSQSFAAIMELHAPRGTVDTNGVRINGYAMPDVDYGNNFVYPAFDFLDPAGGDYAEKHFKLEEANDVFDRILALLTGGKFLSLGGLVNDLLGENVFNQEVFDLIEGLLSSFIGPNGDFADILSMVIELVPELDFLKYYSGQHQEATEEIEIPKYETWKYNGNGGTIDGGAYTIYEKLPSNVVFKIDPSTEEMIESGSFVTIAAGDAIPGAAWNFGNLDSTLYPNDFWDDLQPITDRETFLAAIYKLLSPLVPLLKTFLMGEDFGVLKAPKYNGQDGAIITIPGYRGYEFGFIPLMEGLGLTEGLLTEAQLKAKNGTDFIDGLLAPILGAVEAVSTDPISFVLMKLPQMLFFLFSDALEPAVLNLLKTPLVLVDTARPLLNEQLGILNEYLDYLNINNLLDNLSGVIGGALDGLPVDLSALLAGDSAISDLIKRFIIGTPEFATSKSILAQRSGKVFNAGDDPLSDPALLTQPADDTGKYITIVPETPAVTFFSILSNLLVFAGENVDIFGDILGGLITDPAIVSAIMAVLDAYKNVDRHYKLFDAIYQLLCGVHMTGSDADVYLPFFEMYGTVVPDDIGASDTASQNKAVAGSAPLYNALWTKEMAKDFVDDTTNDGVHERIEYMLDAIIDLILPGMSVGDLIAGILTKGEVLDITLMEDAVFSTAFFNTISDLIIGLDLNGLLDPEILDMVFEYTGLDISAFFSPDVTQVNALAAQIDLADSLQDKSAAFKDALVELLKPFSPLLRMLLTGDSLTLVDPYDLDNGGQEVYEWNNSTKLVEHILTVSGYRGYDFGLAPILAALGMKVPSFEELEMNFGQDNDDREPLDPIISAFMVMLNDLANEPIGFILDNLPNILAFINSGAAHQAVKQLVAPIYSIVKLALGLIEDIEELEELEVAGIVVGDLESLVDDIMAQADLRTLIDKFLSNALIVGGETLTLPANTAAIVEQLVYGVIGVQNGIDIDDNPVRLPVPSGHYPAIRVNADRADTFTALITFALRLADEGNNLEAISKLLGDNMPGVVVDLIGTVAANPHLLLNVLWTFFFGDYKNDQLPMVFDNGSSLNLNKLDNLYREEWWTRRHAKYAWENADHFVNNVWKILFGKPLGSLSLDGLESEANSFVSDLLGTALFTQENFDMIANLIKGYLPTMLEFLDDTVIPGSDETLGDIIKNAVFLYDGSTATALDLAAILNEIDTMTFAPVTGKDSFINNVAQLLAPAMPVVDILLAGMDLKIVERLVDKDPNEREYLITVFGADGYKYGITPILEAFLMPLGGQDAVDTVITAPSVFAGLDGADKIKAIIEPLFWVLDNVAGNPVENILRLIPNLLYTLESSNLSSAINKLLHPVNRIVRQLDAVYDIASLIDFEFNQGGIFLALGKVGGEVGIQFKLSLGTLITGLLSEIGFEIPDSAIRQLMFGTLTEYESWGARSWEADGNTDTDDIYVGRFLSVAATLEDEENFMPDMLTVLIRTIVISFFGSEINRNKLLSWIDETYADNNNMRIILRKTASDIMVFFGEGKVDDDIHGRYILGADIFLNAVFIMFFGLEKVECGIYNTWMNINAKIKAAYESLLTNGSRYDKIFAMNANAFTNKYTFSIVTLDNGVAQNGFIAFFINILAWFKRIFSWLKF